MSDALPNGEKLNVVSLKDYVDVRFVATNEAVKINADVMNARLASMNEFRDALKDQASRLVTREEYKGALENIDKIETTMNRAILREEFAGFCRRIDAIEQWQARQEGKASQTSVIIAYVLSGIGLLVGLFGLVNNWMP